MYMIIPIHLVVLVPIFCLLTTKWLFGLTIVVSTAECQWSFPVSVLPWKETTMLNLHCTRRNAFYSFFVVLIFVVTVKLIFTGMAHNYEIAVAGTNSSEGMDLFRISSSGKRMEYCQTTCYYTYSPTREAYWLLHRIRQGHKMDLSQLKQAMQV